MSSTSPIPSAGGDDDLSATGLVEPAGRFRIYIGAAPGVGKTFAMLEEARRRKGRGADVAIGFAECHGRQTTEALIDDFELVPRRIVEYRGTQFAEMDVDAVFSNGIHRSSSLTSWPIPTSRAQVDIRNVGRMWSSCSMQISTSSAPSISSTLRVIADAVERIIDVPIRERVPDWVLRRRTRSSWSTRPLNNFGDAWCTAISTRPNGYLRRCRITSASTI